MKLWKAAEFYLFPNKNILIMKIRNLIFVLLLKYIFNIKYFFNIVWTY